MLASPVFEAGHDASVIRMQHPLQNEAAFVVRFVLKRVAGNIQWQLKRLRTAVTNAMDV